MTPGEVRAYIVQVSAPEGWELVPRVVRKYAHRNLWAIDAYCHGQYVRTWRAYDVRGLMPAVLEFIESRKPVVVTVDGDGWVRSIDEVA